MTKWSEQLHTHSNSRFRLGLPVINNDLSEVEKRNITKNITKKAMYADLQCTRNVRAFFVIKKKYHEEYYEEGAYIKKK